jgi:hypothetical protein
MTTPEHDSPQSVLGSRLAYCDLPKLPTWEDLNLGHAKSAAFEWQRQRSLARWHEMVWLTEDAARSEWVGEIHGLFGSVGELVLVGIEAEVEKAVLQEALSDEPSGEPSEAAVRATRARALRFFSEGQANNLVIAGHGLANLAVRTFLLHRRLSAETVARSVNLAPNHLRPGALAREAWASLNQATVAALLGQAQAIGFEPLERVAVHLEDFVNDPRWIALVNLRGTQYHRWRGESPGITGVNFESDSLRAQFERGEVVSSGSQMLPAYVEGDRVLEELTQVSREALDALVDFMPGFQSTWGNAFSRLRDVAP